MSKQKVLLLGATGETGGDILDGLLEVGSFDISIFIQPSSANKPSVNKLKDNGLKIVIGSLEGSVDALVPLLSGIDTVISAISASAQLAQLPLVDAAAKAGVKRFVPCGFITVCPPGGIMMLRDDKEIVYNRIFQHHLPYTIIDVGFWHQISFPSLPLGKVDYATILPVKEIFGDGNAPNLLTDKRDIGRFVARIVKDERTLNKKVYTYSDVLSQNQINQMMEKASGEKVEAEHVSIEQLLQQLEGAKAAYAADGTDPKKRQMVYIMEYLHSKYIRCDNTPENAKYLGYIDARELYPDFKPITFEQFIGELLSGKAQRPWMKV